jgi:hypothetical protein
MAITISLHFGLPSEPVISHFGVFSNDRNLLLKVACHAPGTLSDLLSLHSFRSLLPNDFDFLQCQFFQSDETGSSDFGICIDLQTLLADMSGYWFIFSHSFGQHCHSAVGAPEPSAPPESDFDSGPVHQDHNGIAFNPHPFFEAAPLHAGPSAPPLAEHDDSDAAAQLPPPAPGGFAAAPPPPLSSGALLNHQVQSSIRCPLTLDPFVDPVIASDGHTYERSAIMQLFKLERSLRVSPLTREPFANFNLIPNYNMRSLVRDAGYIPDRAENESADFSMGSFQNYVDLGANELEEPLLARDDMRNDFPRGQGLAHQINTVPFPPRFQEKTSSFCCNYAVFIFICCFASCGFNDLLTSQLQSLTWFPVWKTIFTGQIPVCFYVSIAICTGAFSAVLLSCPFFYFPGFCCSNERLRKGLMLSAALLFPFAAISNLGLPEPVRSTILRSLAVFFSFHPCSDFHFSLRSDSLVCCVSRLSFLFLDFSLLTGTLFGASEFQQLLPSCYCLGGATLFTPGTSRSRRASPPNCQRSLLLRRWPAYSSLSHSH